VTLVFVCWFVWVDIIRKFAVLCSFGFLVLVRFVLLLVVIVLLGWFAFLFDCLYT